MAPRFPCPQGAERGDTVPAMLMLPRSSPLRRPRGRDHLCSPRAQLCTVSPRRPFTRLPRLRCACDRWMPRHGSGGTSGRAKLSRHPSFPSTCTTSASALTGLTCPHLSSPVLTCALPPPDFCPLHSPHRGHPTLCAETLLRVPGRCRTRDDRTKCPVVAPFRVAGFLSPCLTSCEYGWLVKWQRAWNLG